MIKISSCIIFQILLVTLAINQHVSGRDLYAKTSDMKGDAYNVDHDSTYAVTMDKNDYSDSGKDGESGNKYEQIDNKYGKTETPVYGSDDSDNKYGQADNKYEDSDDNTYGDVKSTAPVYGDMKQSASAYDDIKTTAPAYGDNKKTASAYGDNKKTASAYDNIKTTAPAYAEKKSTAPSYGESNQYTSMNKYGQVSDQGQQYGQVYNRFDQCDVSEDLTALPGNCRKFRRCANGILYIMRCPAHLVFDNRIKVCNYPENVPAPCGTQRRSSSYGSNIHNY